MEFTFVLLDESAPGDPARHSSACPGGLLIGLSVGMIEKSAKKCYVNLARFRHRRNRKKRKREKGKGREKRRK